jgi:hypothetical protein
LYPTPGSVTPSPTYPFNNNDDNFKFELDIQVAEDQLDLTGDFVSSNFTLWSE